MDTKHFGKTRWLHLQSQNDYDKDASRLFRQDDKKCGYSELGDWQTDDSSTDSAWFLLDVCLDNSSTLEMDAVHSSKIAVKFYLFLKITVSYEYIQKPVAKIFPVVKRMMLETSVTM
jgi:hypothetical protein